MGIALASFVFGLPFNAVARLTASIQRGWIHAGWIVAGSTTSLVIVILAAYFHLGFLAFLAAALLIPSLQMVGLWIQIFRGSLGWSFKPTQTAPWIEVREILRSSALFAFPQIGMAPRAKPAAAQNHFHRCRLRRSHRIQLVEHRLFPIPSSTFRVCISRRFWPAYTRSPHCRRPPLDKESASEKCADVASVLRRRRGYRVAVTLLDKRCRIRTPNSYPGNQIALITAVWIALQIAIQPSIFFLAGIGRLKELAWAATPGLFVGVAALFIGTRLRSALRRAGNRIDSPRRRSSSLAYSESNDSCGSPLS